MILNEYIKNTKNVMCPQYVKLLNKILDGDFPSEQVVWVVIPYFKNMGLMIVIITDAYFYTAVWGNYLSLF